jgi:hypothetical protein
MVFLNLAPYPKRSLHWARLDARDPDAALQQTRLLESRWIMRGNTQHTPQVFTCNQRHVRQTVESDAAEVLRNRLDSARSPVSKQQHTPVDLCAGSFASFRLKGALYRCELSGTGVCTEEVEKVCGHK